MPQVVEPIRVVQKAISHELGGENLKYRFPRKTKIKQ